MPSQKNKPETTPDDVLLMSIAVQLRGVMGDSQKRRDITLIGEYEIDRAACEEAIRKAQAELDAAGEGVDGKENEFALAWAWHGLSVAFERLASVEARMRLARRRAVLEEAAKAKVRHGI